MALSAIVKALPALRVSDAPAAAVVVMPAEMVPDPGLAAKTAPLPTLTAVLSSEPVSLRVPPDTVVAAV